MVCLLAAAALCSRDSSAVSRHVDSSGRGGAATGVAIGSPAGERHLLRGAGASASLLVCRATAASAVSADIAPALPPRLPSGSNEGWLAAPVRLSTRYRLQPARHSAVSTSSRAHRHRLGQFRSEQSGRGPREWFWSARLLQWMPLQVLLCGCATLAPDSSAARRLVWARFLIVRGLTPLSSSVESGSFFRYLMPACFPRVLCRVRIDPLVDLHPGRPARSIRATKHGSTVGGSCVAVIVIAQSPHSLSRPLPCHALSTDSDAIPCAPVLPFCSIPRSTSGDRSSSAEARTHRAGRHPSAHGTSVSRPRVPKRRSRQEPDEPVR